MGEISQAVQSHPSFCTVQRLFRTLHMRKWKQCKRLEITEGNPEKRLNWARIYALYTLEDFRQVIWLDECPVECGVGAYSIWIFTSPSRQIIERDICTIWCGKGVKQMFWAAFGFDWWTGLLLFNRDPESAHGGVTTWVIHSVYEAFLPEFSTHGDIFIHDGASAHRAYIVWDRD